MTKEKGAIIGSSKDNAKNPANSKISDRGTADLLIGAVKSFFKRETSKI